MKKIKNRLSFLVVVLLLSVLGIGVVNTDSSSAGGRKKVAILKTKNLKVYNQAITAFKTNCPTFEYLDELNMKEDMGIAKDEINTINNSQPDLLLSIGTKASMAAKSYLNSSIPMVFAVVLNPDRQGLHAENITGVRLEIPVEVQLKTIKALVPNIRKVGVLYNPANSKKIIDKAKSVANRLGIELLASRVETKDDTVDALDILESGIDAYWLIPDPTVVTREAFKMILKFTTKKNIPFFAYSKAFVKNGALISLTIDDYSTIGQQACEVAKKILNKNIPPSQIPFQYPRGLEIAVNITMAKNLHLTSIATNAFTFAAQNGYKISVLQ